MNTTQAAEKIAMSASTIRRWCRTGRIIATKVGRAWHIDPAALPIRSKEHPVAAAQEPTEAYEIEVGAHEISIFPQRARFGRRTSEDRPVRWNWCIDGYDYSEVSYETAAKAEAAGRRQLGLDSDHAACIGCGKAATMNASTGKTCTDCYDNYTD